MMKLIIRFINLYTVLKLWIINEQDGVPDTVEGEGDEEEDEEEVEGEEDDAEEVEGEEYDEDEVEGEQMLRRRLKRRYKKEMMMKMLKPCLTNVLQLQCPLILYR